MRCAVIFNPTARGGKARQFRETLRALGDADLELHPTTSPGTAPAIAAQAAHAGAELIVAAGGDGTVSEVVHGLAGDPDLLARTTLGIVPLGTINVFARELGLPTDLTAAWRVAREGRTLRVDLPVAEFRRDDQPATQAFAQLAGAGLDSRAIACVSWEIKKRVGPLAYLLAGLQALRGPHPRIRVTGPSGEAEGPLALAGNGRLYGGHVEMQPGANLTDGQLAVRVFRRVGFGTLMRFGLAWLLRRPLPPADDVCLRGAEFEFTSDRPTPLELDGDNVGHLPARFTLRPAALRVRAPE